MRLLILTLLALCSALAQDAAPDSGAVTFQAQTRLVMLSFHVLHGKGYAPDLKQSDVILLEDGKPRPFTIFDSPATQGRLPIELVLLFDGNPPIQSLWDPFDVFRFISLWQEPMSRAILEQQSADLRISVYHCTGRLLFRMHPATTEAALVTQSLRGILKPFPTDRNIPIHIPDERQRVESGPFTGDYQTSPFISAAERGWPMEAAIGAMDDAVSGPDKVARALVMFSEGIGATTTVPEDVGNHALDLGVPIYPVATNYQSQVTDRYPRNLFRMRQFEALGKMTGGRSVEVSYIDATMLRKILENVRAHALAEYLVGFPPHAEGSAKAHKLEIKLASKSLGTIEGGKLRAVY